MRLCSRCARSAPREAASLSLSDSVSSGCLCPSSRGLIRAAEMRPQDQAGASFTPLPHHLGVPHIVRTRRHRQARGTEEEAPLGPGHRSHGTKPAGVWLPCRGHSGWTLRRIPGARPPASLLCSGPPPSAWVLLVVRCPPPRPSSPRPGARLSGIRCSHTVCSDRHILSGGWGGASAPSHTASTGHQLPAPRL